MIVWSISEYAAKGCLFDYLTNNKLHFDQILRWSTDIALGKWSNLKHAHNYIFLHMYLWYYYMLNLSHLISSFLIGLPHRGYQQISFCLAVHAYDCISKLDAVSQVSPLERF